ncbi:hypothetical protein BC829DRAFT_454016 [Chytridium lagenaria]|nr:hypothetical protein BC829DRAFT_454016 [Chytridium lagenaria]
MSGELIDVEGNPSSVPLLTSRLDPPPPTPQQSVESISVARESDQVILESPHQTTLPELAEGYYNRGGYERKQAVKEIKETAIQQKVEQGVDRHGRDASNKCQPANEARAREKEEKYREKNQRKTKHGGNRVQRRRLKQKEELRRQRENEERKKDEDDRTSFVSLVDVRTRTSSLGVVSRVNVAEYHISSTVETPPIPDNLRFESAIGDGNCLVNATLLALLGHECDSQTRANVRRFIGSRIQRGIGVDGQGRRICEIGGEDDYFLDEWDPFPQFGVTSIDSPEFTSLVQPSASVGDQRFLYAMVVDHTYSQALTITFSSSGRPVIVYSQIGAGQGWNQTFFIPGRHINRDDVSMGMELALDVEPIYLMIRGEGWRSHFFAAVRINSFGHFESANSSHRYQESVDSDASEIPLVRNRRLRVPLAEEAVNDPPRQNYGLNHQESVDSDASEIPLVRNRRIRVRLAEEAVNDLPRQNYGLNHQESVDSDTSEVPLVEK